ncbi:MAG TPA: CDP-alcohol phosphatidyltransferase family protein [Methylomirabilota bacterium]|nr:CDP-alcohol phosphatidyltransferase family protein [Methylomirabilota bacterium]
MPPAADAERGVAGLRVAGLTLLRRLVLAAFSAGYARVLVADDAGPPASLQGTEAAGLAAAPVSSTAWRRAVVLPANVVPQKRWLKALQELPLERDTLYADAELGVGVVETQRLEAVTAAAHGNGAPGALERLGKVFEARALASDPGGAMAVHTPADARPAERWLYRALIKQNEGFMSRHFERRLSMAVTRLLVDTPATPNMLTLVSVAIGLAGAVCFLSTHPAWQLTGALLFLAHSILDGCDGELARLKFMESRHGAVLDFWGDNIVHFAVFSCIAIGWALAAQSPWPLLVGGVAVAAAAGTAAFMFKRFAEDRTTTGTWGARLIGAMSHRDFIYIVVALSAFGRAHWFLIATAIGTPLFLLLALLFLRNHDGRVS